ncbi:MAG: tyrosine-protein phosphatase [Lactobacillus sp.]|nr:tyrosine-protein phosphatase [Lactobacillus sp.]MDN6042597.1 tyrosine-protein phosphatase [Lactobacillus sp.]MDN6052496.1 tyrosine-protein phosphatase [Lactobacillus sp.]
MPKKLTHQLIGVTSGRNFRELGGYRTLSGKTIKYHKLIRTGNWSNLSPAGQTYLHQYGVKTIIDFRSQVEVTKGPDRVPEDTRYHYAPVFSTDLTNASKGMNDLNVSAHDDGRFGFKNMISAYEDMIQSSSAQKAYRTFFDLLLANTAANEAVAFHCTAGKDRTGFAALLALTALGVPLTTIKTDYLLTNITTQDFVSGMLNKASQHGANHNVLQAIRDIQSVRPEYLDHSLKLINHDYNGLNAYLHQVMHLSSADIMELRHIYLTA